MNPLLMKVADGTSFFAGMLIVLAAIVTQVWLRRRVVRSMLSIVAFLGVLLVVLSSTPLPTGEYVVWLLFLAGAIITLYRQRSSWEGLRVRLLAVGLFTAVSLMLCLQELHYRWSPRILVTAAQPVYVIGDSLSSGIGRGEKVWPDVLAERSGLTVKNLAVGGSKLQNAMAQARTVPPDNVLVILEIGGNDVLGNGKAPTETAVFYRHLEDLLKVLASRHPRMTMFELPLPPFGNGYGKAQRQLAGKYGVTLIPKTCLAGALALPDGTLDGLHLSQKGHDYLAAHVNSLLVKSALAVAPSVPSP